MPKEKILNIRLTVGMSDLITKNSKRKGITVSEYIRQLVIADSKPEEVKEMLMK